MSQKRFKLVRDFLTLASGQVLSKVIVFVTFAYLARTLKTEKYGVLEFVVALAMFSAIAVDMGLGILGARELAKDRRAAQRLSATIPAARLLLACLVVPLMGLAARLMGHSGETVELVWLFALALFALPFRADWLFQGLEIMRTVAGGEVIRALAFAAAALAFVHGPEDLVTTGYAEIIAATSVAIFFLLSQLRVVGPPRLRFSVTEFRALLRPAIGVGLSEVVWAVNQYVQIFILISIVGEEKTAFFGVSNRIVAALIVFSFVYHFNLFPALVRATQTSKEAFERLLRCSCRVIAWAGVSVALFFALFSEPLLVMVYGEEFGAGSTALSILVWSLPITMLSGHARKVLLARHRHRQLMWVHVAGMIVTLALGPLLIVYYEADGAAIAMVAASTAVWVTAHLLARDESGRLPFAGVLVQPALLSGAVTLILYVSQPDLWIAVAIYVVGMASAPLVDRQLLTDVRALAHAKSV